MKKKNLALYDFDGTITTKDSFIEFLKYCCGKINFYIGLLKLSPFIILFYVGKLKNSILKEKFLTYFLKGMTRVEFEQKCTLFAENRIPKMIKDSAMKSIVKHQAEGNDVIIVTASPFYYIEPWAQKKSIRVLGTKLQFLDEKLTGKLYEANCYGKVKVDKAKKEIKLDEYDLIYAYGDSKGDKELLEFADKSYYRYFN